MEWYEDSNFSTNRISYIFNKNEDVTLYARWLDETNDDYFTWNTTENEAIITGFSTTGLEVYNAGNLTALVIPKVHNNLPVTTINDNAFKNKDLLETLVIQDNIIQIGTYSTFENCSNISELVMPISVDVNLNAGSYAFNGCTGIRKIYFSKRKWYRKKL